MLSVTVRVCGFRSVTGDVATDTVGVATDTDDAVNDAADNDVHVTDINNRDITSARIDERNATATNTDDSDVTSVDDERAPVTTCSMFRRVLRAALPLQALLLIVALASMLPVCEDDWHCVLVNNLEDSLTPMLRYVRGPPPS